MADFNLTTQRCTKHGKFRCPECLGLPPAGKGPMGGWNYTADYLERWREAWQKLLREAAGHVDEKG